MKIYVASSWRNQTQPSGVQALRGQGHDVYDFRNPSGRDNGFHWSDIDPEWKSWCMEEYRTFIDHPIAATGFQFDWDAMQWADACVLVMPSGRSAHIEAGYFVGAGKRLAILLSDGEPELMYKMADCLCVDINEVFAAIREWEP